MASDNVEIFGHLLGYGAAFIASAVAIYTANKANVVAQTANRISNKSLSMTTDLKIIEYREKWISNLRVHMSAYLTLINTLQYGGVDVTKIDPKILYEEHDQIVLHLNPTDDTHNKAIEKSVAAIATALGSTAKTKAGKSLSPVEPDELAKIFQDILKREWEQIKVDLERYKEKL